MCARRIVPTIARTINLSFFKETNEFTQSLVNEDKIYYVNNGGTVTADEVNLRVRCRDAVTSVQLGIWILPASYWKPLVVRNLRTLVVEETTSALLSKSVLEVSCLLFF